MRGGISPRLAAYIVVALIVALLAACGDQPPPSDDKSAPSLTENRPAPSSISDKAALIALYNAAGGADWKKSDNWLSDKPLDEWIGVSADAEDRVIALDLHDNDLTGPIPPELGNLSRLESLGISDSGLAEIPPELGNLSRLESLGIGYNDLTEIPPELGNLSNLICCTSMPTA